MDWNIGWVFWIGCSYFLTIVNCYFVLVKKAKYNCIIGVSGIAFFSVALLEELRMFSQWIEDGEVGMLTHALQNLPVQFTIRFLIVVGITTLLLKRSQHVQLPAKCGISLQKGQKNKRALRPSGKTENRGCFHTSPVSFFFLGLLI